jgi:hypothetical protein
LILYERLPISVGVFAGGVKAIASSLDKAIAFSDSQQASHIRLLAIS